MRAHANIRNISSEFDQSLNTTDNVQFANINVSTINNAAFPDLTTINAHISSTAAHGATGAIVGTTNTQTLINKTLTAPIISTINNGGTITVPSTTGTLALVSQIPTNTTYVDLTTNQTVNGTKTFDSTIINQATAPGLLVTSTQALQQIGHRITFTGTSPNGTSDCRIHYAPPVGRFQIGTQTAQGIDLFTNAGTRLTVLDASTTISNTLRVASILDATGGNTAQINSDVATNASNIQTLTNKTINSASNTLTITNAPLSAVNINTLINQDVETTASPTFVRDTWSNFSSITKAIFANNTANTTITTQNVYVTVNSTAIVNSLISNNFTSGAITQLTYTGANRRLFFVSYTTSIQSTGSNTNFSARLTLNGTSLDQSVTFANSSNAANSQCLSSSFLQSLGTNDVILMQVANNSNTNALLVVRWCITAYELPF